MHIVFIVMSLSLFAAYPIFYILIYLFRWPSQAYVCLTVIFRKAQYVATKPKHSKTKRNRCIIYCMEHIFHMPQQLCIDVQSTEHAQLTTSALMPKHCRYWNKVINYFSGFRWNKMYSFWYQNQDSTCHKTKLMFRKSDNRVYEEWKFKALKHHF